MHETNLNSSINPWVKYKVCMTWQNVSNTWLLPSQETSDEQHTACWSYIRGLREFLNMHTLCSHVRMKESSLASWCTSHAKLNLISIYVLMGYVHVGWKHSMFGNFTDWEKYEIVSSFTPLTLSVLSMV
jgi:hypothetical protein